MFVDAWLRCRALSSADHRWRSKSTLAVISYSNSLYIVIVFYSWHQMSKSRNTEPNGSHLLSDFLLFIILFYWNICIALRLEDNLLKCIQTLKRYINALAIIALLRCCESTLPKAFIFLLSTSTIFWCRVTLTDAQHFGLTSLSSIKRSFVTQMWNNLNRISSTQCERIWLRALFTSDTISISLLRTWLLEPNQHILRQTVRQKGTKSVLIMK